jgi:hypothetical protein
LESSLNFHELRGPEAGDWKGSGSNHAKWKCLKGPNRQTLLQCFKMGKNESWKLDLGKAADSWVIDKHLAMKEVKLLFRHQDGSTMSHTK